MSESMVYAICTRYWDKWRECVWSWDDHAAERHPYILIPMMPIPICFEAAYRSTTEPIIAMLHDDLVIHERNWDQRVLKQFEDPTVGLVGFAGALAHGQPHLYTRPFHIPNMVRRRFVSNMRDAERHGMRYSKECDVAVLDGMALFVRRSVLDKWGGWPVDKPVGYYLYAEHLCCEVRRQGMRIRFVGVDVEHLGGKSSGTTLSYSHEAEHRYLYDTSRDVLPYEVPNQ